MHQRKLLRAADQMECHLGQMCRRRGLTRPPPPPADSIGRKSSNDGDAAAAIQFSAQEIIFWDMLRVVEGKVMRSYGIEPSDVAALLASSCDLDINIKPGNIRLDLEIENSSLYHRVIATTLALWAKWFPDMKCLTLFIYPNPRLTLALRAFCDDVT